MNAFIAIFLPVMLFNFLWWMRQTQTGTTARKGTYVAGDE
jgi:hypothetical protein